MSKLQEKIRELQRRAPYMDNSVLSVDAKGELVDERRIKGYLIVWGVRDSYGTVFLKGCCAKSIQERGPKSNGKYKIKFLWQHDQMDPLCEFDVLQEDDYGLYFEAVPDDVPNGERAVKQVRSGTLNQFSVGFDYIWDKIEYAEDVDALILKEIDLFEGSIVTIPSNMETYALRNKETFEKEAEIVREETEDFIKSLNRKQQIIARDLLTRNISLATFKPDELRHKTLEDQEPVEGFDYEYILQNLKLI
jgi:HK97 family phage prohead protease